MSKTHLWDIVNYRMISSVVIPALLVTDVNSLTYPYFAKKAPD